MPGKAGDGERAGSQETCLTPSSCFRSGCGGSRRNTAVATGGVVIAGTDYDFPIDRSRAVRAGRRLWCTAAHVLRRSESQPVSTCPTEGGREQAVLLSWSGGKDSCFALHEIQKTWNIRVAALLTTVTRA